MQTVVLTEAGEEGLIYALAVAEHLRCDGYVTLLFNADDSQIEPVRPKDFATAAWYAEEGGAEVMVVCRATEQYVIDIDAEAFSTFGDNYDFPWDTLVTLTEPADHEVKSWSEYGVELPAESRELADLIVRHVQWEVENGA